MGGYYFLISMLSIYFFSNIYIVDCSVSYIIFTQRCTDICHNTVVSTSLADQMHCGHFISLIVLRNDIGVVIK